VIDVSAEEPGEGSGSSNCNCWSWVTMKKGRVLGPVIDYYYCYQYH
jgi:hypothetical protein